MDHAHSLTHTPETNNCQSRGRLSLRKKMSKKRQQTNGFALFMRDMQSEMRERGRHVQMRDMSVLAGPKWAKLPAREKAVYNARAKSEKRGDGGVMMAARYGIMDSAGELLSERRDFEAELEERRRRERAIIKSSLAEGSEVMLTNFFFVDIQSLCEIPDKPHAKYQPCEIAVIEFTLHSGICRSFHRFIEPGPLPLGYRFEAKKMSDATHEVPLSGFDQAVGDYRHLVWEIESFINPDGKRDIPAMFASRENALRVEWCLEWLANKAGVRNRLDRVYELEALLCELSCHRDGRGPTIHQANKYLHSTFYDHSMGTRCEYHEEKENKYCSLGVVKKYCYVLSDTLCPKYNISLAASHLPPQSANQSQCSVFPPSRQSVYSSYGGSRATSPPPSPSPPPPLISTSPSSSSASAYSFPQMRGVGELSQQMDGLSMGRGRGRGRGFVFREPRTVGGHN